MGETDQAMDGPADQRRAIVSGHWSRAAEALTRGSGEVGGPAVHLARDLLGRHRVCEHVLVRAESALAAGKGPAPLVVRSSDWIDSELAARLAGTAAATQPPAASSAGNVSSLESARRQLAAGTPWSEIASDMVPSGGALLVPATARRRMAEGWRKLARSAWRIGRGRDAAAAGAEHLDRIVPGVRLRPLAVGTGPRPPALPLGRRHPGLKAVQHREGTPEVAVQPALASLGSDEAQGHVRRLLGAGRVGEALHTLVVLLRRGREVRTLSALHAALQQVRASDRAIDRARRGLGPEAPPIRSLEALRPWSAEAADAWLAWTGGGLRGAIGAPGEPATALLTEVRERLAGGASWAEIEPLLPRSPSAASMVASLRLELMAAAKPGREAVRLLRAHCAAHPGEGRGWLALATSSARCGLHLEAARACQERLGAVLPRRMQAGAPPPPSVPALVSPVRAPALSSLREGAAGIAGVDAELRLHSVSGHVLAAAADRLGLDRGAVRSLTAAMPLTDAEVAALDAWSARALAAAAGRDGEPVEALLRRAMAEVARNGGRGAVTALLPRSGAARLRSALIEAEALQRGPHTGRGQRLLVRTMGRALHVTRGHRLLAGMARSEGRHRDAARHLEGAMLSPHTPLMHADLPESMPCRIATMPGDVAVYCYRGRVFAVERGSRFVGVTVVAGRLLVLRDTRGYRAWRSVRRSRPVRAVGRICRRLLGRRGDGAADRIRGPRWQAVRWALVWMRTGMRRMPGAHLAARGLRAGRRFGASHSRRALRGGKRLLVRGLAALGVHGPLRSAKARLSAASGSVACWMKLKREDLAPGLEAARWRLAWSVRWLGCRTAHAVGRLVRPASAVYVRGLLAGMRLLLGAEPAHTVSGSGSVGGVFAVLGRGKGGDRGGR